MISKYMVKHDSQNEIYLVDTWDEVIRLVKNATFAWCNDPIYEGCPWDELFHECLKDKDFGDIVNVFEVQNDQMEILFPERGQTFEIKRIL